ncbi:polymorphic toxin-type HINT domain-containing protein [Streptomyces sp. NPDC050421]|uniref:RHS repeat domain-containing protein n=1 Tax=Streptomyces sp. NPDC050421 TaxID=3365613 RepID=UPI003797721A
MGSTSATLLLSLLSIPAVAAEGGFQQRSAPKTESVDGSDLKARVAAARPAPAKAWKPAAVAWPNPGHAAVDLSSVGKAANGKRRAGSLPVAVTPVAAGKSLTGIVPAKVDVTLLDRAATRRAGVEGLLLKVQRTDGERAAGGVRVEVDYASIRDAYGAGWSSRLRLVRLPACVLTTPAEPACRTATPLTTDNDATAHTLTAPVTLQAAPTASASAGGAMTVLAATSEATGDEGSFKATSLSPSGSWSAGGNSGGFAWNVPLAAPAVPGGLAPKIGLSYNSSSVDGRTASTNNQSSWIGEGWEYSPGYIERSYVSCENDKEGGNNTTKVGDLCWKSENATLSLNGASNQLVYAGNNTWKLKGDDGSRVERVYDTSSNNSGDDDFEYWKVTTQDGTQYWFGKNRLPGWDSGKAETNSVFTVPVYGNHSSEPGHGADFASSAETQGWRWNLDYVVDPRGNAMAMYYTKETGYYAQNSKTDSPKPYTRGGYLAKIDYGLRDGAVYTTANPAARITFASTPRCLTDCTFDESHATSWPDTPVDLDCASTGTCLQFGPSFWTNKRLTAINTYALLGTTMTAVDAWALTQSFPNTGDTSSPALWLDSIQRTAKAGALADILLPKTIFSSEPMANRVDAAEGRPPLFKRRLTKITNETGGQTLVTYSPTECTPTTVPSADSNTKRCYPAWWTPEGAVDPVKDWWHKYVVTQVIEDDTTFGTGSASKVTSYEYANGPNWRRDTGEFSLEKQRTWSDFRGYGTVRTYVGATNRTKSENTYFLGMAGDTLANGTARSVAKINGVTDREDFAGRVAQSRTYDKDGTGGKIVAKTTYTPWESAATATQAVTGITDPDKPGVAGPSLPAKTARFSGTVTEAAATLLDDGATWRTLTTNRTYDATYGLLLSEGDDGAGQVETKCTRTSYVTPNTTKWLISYPETVTTTKHSPCNMGYLNPAVLSSSRTYYDNQALGVAPKPGQANITKTEQVAKRDASDNLVWEATLQSATFDAYGRPLTAKGQAGQPTTTEYAPPTGAQPTTITVTDAKGYTTSTDLDGLRGLTLRTTDANARTASSQYDAVGRLIKGWRAGRATTTTPNAAFTYTLSSAAPSTVTSKTLYEDGTLGTNITLVDSLLRPRQTQSDAIGVAGRVITDSFYDDHGRAYRSNTSYYNNQPAGTTPFVVTDNQVPAATLLQYDSRGRTTASIQLSLNVEKWRTTTSYGDVWTATVPPAGDVATLGITDVRGRLIEHREYKDRNPVVGAAAAQYEKTTRSYDMAGQLTKVVEPSGRNSWTYGYDLRGRQTTTTDPDKGTTTLAYGSDGRLQTSTDARGVTLATTYDVLGRKTSLRKDSVAGAKLAEWAYDTAPAGKGLPASATRYDSTVAAGAAYTTAVIGYDSSGQSTGTKVTIPSVTGEEKLAGTYTIATTATSTNGLAATAAYSTGNTNATTALPAETVTNHYGAQDQLAIVDGTLSQVYLRGASYTPFGELGQAELGNSGSRVFQTNSYDTVTGRLTKSIIDRETTGPITLSNTQYTYDPAGNVTRIRDDQNDGTMADDQCFAYDWARRMTEAWTTADACATKPANGTPVLGTVDPYWTSWSFTDTGQRAKETQHKAGPVTADTTRTYTYPTTTGAAQAHGLRSVTATGGATGTDNYTYDAIGNLKTKTPAGGATQTLAWNDEGKLATSTLSSATTSFLYDTEGTRLLRRDSTATTLYLPGGQELALTKAAGTLAGTRYYTVPGGSAVRTSSDDKVRILVADHHGTNQLSISATTLTTNRRKALPYGSPRGTAPAFWPGQKGFVGGDIDPTTNLTHIGAREYDPTIGQFISVDPVMSLDQAQSLNGYSYANQHPATSSDPTGLCDDPVGNGHCRPGKLGTDAVDTAYKPNGELADTGGSDSGSGSGSGSGSDSGGTASGSNGDSGDNCSWWTKCGLKQTWDNYKAPIVSMAAEVTAGAICYTTTISSAPMTGGASLIGTAGCGAVAGAAGALAYNWMSDDADHSAGGQFGDMAEGAVWGAGGTVVTTALAAKILCHSFLPGTGVLLADGTRRAIEDVEVGDTVTTTDTTTGKAVKKKVVDTITTEDDKAFTDITITADGGRSSITATDTHPFWVPELKDWIQAGSLQIGQWLRTSAGTHVQITALSHYTKQQRTHDLTIEDIHAYYVLAGATPVLVHNCNLSGYADSIRNEPGVKFASEYTSPSGAKYYGRNKHGQQAEGSLADAIERTGHHGGCAEVHCLIQAQAAEGPEAIRGGTMRTVKSRNNSMPTSNPVGHGEPGRPCGLCKGLLEYLAIN